MSTEPLTPTQKANKAKHSKLTRKQIEFTKEYVATLNGTQSALKVYDTTSANVASVIGAENLAKPRIKAEIERLLGQNDIQIAEILTVHKRNMLQEENLPTSQKAIGDFYDILGMRNTDKPTTDVKIAFIIEK